MQKGQKTTCSKCDACLLQCNQYLFMILFSSFQLSHFKTSAENLKESNTEINSKVESYMQKLKEVKHTRLWVSCSKLSYMHVVT